MDKKLLKLPAVFSGIALLSSGFFLLLISPSLAIIPFLFYLMLCGVMPFFPTLGFFTPTIHKLAKPSRLKRKIALTFDDGPTPSSTPIILDILKQYNLKATFFVTGERAVHNPALIRAILADGHWIGNHSWDHDYFLMFRSSEDIFLNINRTQSSLKKLGVTPSLFRPPVGITGPRLHDILNKLHLHNVVYNCQAYDRGNRNVANLADKILDKIKPGDIVLLHDLYPVSPELAKEWKQELTLLCQGLAENFSTTSLQEDDTSPEG